MKNKKIIILWHNGGRMANQLWQHIAVQAFCLEKNYKLENHSFFEYSHIFKIAPNNNIINILFHKPYIPLKKILPKSLYSDPHNYFYRKYYKIYVKLIKLFFKKNILNADKKLILLPPTEDNKMLDDFDASSANRLYFNGWRFRNPKGIKKYQKQITTDLIKDNQDAIKSKEYIKSLKEKYNHVVGVHIRHGDYSTFLDGKLFFREDEVNKILNSYVDFFKKDKEKTVFIICSDGKIDLKKFDRLNIEFPNKSFMEDLFMLAYSDFIIGANSTFGGIASFLGNATLAIFQRKNVDWDYYKNRDGFFEDKYLTMMDY